VLARTYDHGLPDAIPPDATDEQAAA
jgi:hypothetical protein